jgi:polyribonucleotide nucleotidyltransferase
VAGTTDGITALQMDIKIEGVTPQIMREALAQAKTARFSILNFMKSVIEKPSADLAPGAPRIDSLYVRPDQVGMVIGPGGKMIRSIVENSGAKIDIEDDGKVIIAASNGESLRIARQMIEALTKDVEVGCVYDGKVVTIKDFGAFVEVLPGKEGLLHISQISEQRVHSVQDVLRPGDSIRVRVREIDAQGRINLTARQLS